MIAGPGLFSTSPAFMRSSASHLAGPYGRPSPKTINREPLTGEGGVNTICTTVCQTAVTAPPRVSCVVWRHMYGILFYCINKRKLMKKKTALRTVQDAHKTQIYNICLTKHSQSHTRAPTAPRLTIQTENTTSIKPLTQTQHTSTLQGLKKTIF